MAIYSVKAYPLNDSWEIKAIIMEGEVKTIILINKSSGINITFFKDKRHVHIHKPSDDGEEINFMGTTWEDMQEIFSEMEELE